MLKVLLLFLGGAVVGSFLSVVITRIYEGKKGIVSGRSECPECGAKLQIEELVPVFSYLAQRGKCRHCGGRISSFYLWVELVMGMVFVIAGVMIVDFWHLSYMLVLLSLLVMIGFFDLRYKMLPDLFSVLLGVWAVVGLFFGWGGDWWGVMMAILLVLAFFGGQIWLSKGAWLGEGDLILGLALAIFVGWPGILLLLMLAYTLGAAVGVGLWAGGYIKKGAQVPFAPFLVMATVVTVFWGEMILDYYWKCQILNVCNF